MTSLRWTKPPHDARSKRRRDTLCCNPNNGMKVPHGSAHFDLSETPPPSDLLQGEVASHSIRLLDTPPCGLQRLLDSERIHSNNVDTDIHAVKVSCPLSPLRQP